MLTGIPRFKGQAQNSVVASLVHKIRPDIGGYADQYSLCNDVANLHVLCDNITRGSEERVIDIKQLAINFDRRTTCRSIVQLVTTFLLLWEFSARDPSAKVDWLEYCFVGLEDKGRSSKGIYKSADPVSASMRSSWPPTEIKTSQTGPRSWATTAASSLRWTGSLKDFVFGFESTSGVATSSLRWTGSVNASVFDFKSDCTSGVGRAKTAVIKRDAAKNICMMVGYWATSAIKELRELRAYNGVDPLLITLCENRS